MQIKHQVMYENQLLSRIKFKLKYIPNLENIIIIKILPVTYCQDWKKICWQCAAILYWWITICYLAEPQGEFGVSSFPLDPSAGSVFGSLSFLDGSDHQLQEPGRIFSWKHYLLSQSDKRKGEVINKGQKEELVWNWSEKKTKQYGIIYTKYVLFYFNNK